jgi:hypothetical protein
MVRVLGVTALATTGKFTFALRVFRQAFGGDSGTNIDRLCFECTGQLATCKPQACSPLDSDYEINYRDAISLHAVALSFIGRHKNN